MSDSLQDIVRTLAENSDMNLEAADIGKQLKVQWREHHTGGCGVITKGSECGCHLCLIDRLVELVYKK